MAEMDRVIKISDIIWYWLPARWTNGTAWFEISGFTITGDEVSGGVDIHVNKNGETTTLVSFTNDELYGVSAITPEGARQRIEAV